MSILNHCATSGGQPGFPLKGSAIQDANQHYQHIMKPTQPMPTIKAIGEAASLLSKKPDASFISKKQGIEELSQHLTKNDYTHSMVYETLFMGAVELETFQVSDEPNVVLAVSVSSAVKLDERQVTLIARKMKRLTGFTNLRLENTIDPTLIAGFVISYSDDGSHVIDLSVKGQLATLAYQVESFDKWIPSPAFAIATAMVNLHFGNIILGLLCFKRSPKMPNQTGSAVSEPALRNANAVETQSKWALNLRYSF